MMRQGDELPVAEGRFVHVFVDRTTRRPQPIAAGLRAAMEGLLAPSTEPVER
jgi:acyl-CoA thioester hydrolase